MGRQRRPIREPAAERALSRPPPGRQQAHVIGVGRGLLGLAGGGVDDVELLVAQSTAGCARHGSGGCDHLATGLPAALRAHVAGLEARLQALCPVQLQCSAPSQLRLGRSCVLPGSDCCFPAGAHLLTVEEAMPHRLEPRLQAEAIRPPSSAASSGLLLSLPAIADDCFRRRLGGRRNRQSQCTQCRPLL